MTVIWKIYSVANKVNSLICQSLIYGKYSLDTGVIEKVKTDNNEQLIWDLNSTTNQTLKLNVLLHGRRDVGIHFLLFPVLFFKIHPRVSRFTFRFLPLSVFPTFTR